MRKNNKGNPYSFDVNSYLFGGDLFNPKKADPMGMYDFGQTDTNNLPKQEVPESGAQDMMYRIEPPSFWGGETGQHDDYGWSRFGRQPQPLFSDTYANLANKNFKLDPPSVLDVAPGHLLYVWRQLGDNLKFNFKISDYHEQIKKGKTLDDILTDEERQKMERDNALATELAAKVAHLPREQYDAYMAELRQTIGQQVAAPRRPDLENPNPWGAAAAGIAAMLTPEHAFDIASTPFQHGPRKQEQGYQADKERFTIEQQAKQERQRLLMSLLELQDRRDRATQDAEQKQIDNELKIVQDRLDRVNQQIIAEGRVQGAIEKEKIKNDADEREKNIHAYYNAKGLENRHNAWLALGGPYSGLEEPKELTPGESKDISHGGYYDAKAESTRRLVDDQEKYLQSRVNVNNSTANLNSERAKKVAKETWWMDKEKAVNIAKGWASIDNIKSMISDRTIRQDFKRQDIAIKAWGESQKDIIATKRSLSAQANTIRQKMAQLNSRLADKKTKDSEKAALRQSLTNYQTDLNSIAKQWNELNSESRAVRDAIRTLPERQGGISNDHVMLRKLVESRGFVVTDGYATKGHNPGSKHYVGKAVDVRTKDRSDAEIEAFIQEMKALGVKVVDERKGPPRPGMTWTNEHLHLEFDTNIGTSKPKQGQSKPKQNKPRTGSVSVPGVGTVTYRRG